MCTSLGWGPPLLISTCQLGPLPRDRVQLLIRPRVGPPHPHSTHFTDRKLEAQTRQSQAARGAFPGGLKETLPCSTVSHGSPAPPPRISLPLQSLLACHLPALTSLCLRALGLVLLSGPHWQGLTSGLSSHCSFPWNAVFQISPGLPLPSLTPSPASVSHAAKTQPSLMPHVHFSADT